MSAALWERWFCRPAIQALDQRLRRLPDRPLRVLDLGCGTGRNLNRLASAGVELASYTGVDQSTRMLQQARKNHPYTQASFVPGDATVAAQEAKDCDLILATWILSHQSKPTVLLEAAQQALAPNGRLLVLALTATKQITAQVQSWHFRRFRHAAPIDPAVFQQSMPTHITVTSAGLVHCVEIGQEAPG